MTRRHLRPLRLSLLAWVLCACVGVALVSVWDGDPPAAEEPAQRGVMTNLDGAGSLPSRPPRARTSRDPARAPVRLDIEVIGVSTPLVPLGLLHDRSVEVPVDPDHAGWFRRGPEPGRLGSSVILGHVDSPRGPAVFARLDELDPGDTVIVGRADGSEVEFVVRKAATYLNADFPAQRVYAAQGARRLNLVTCAGTYDPDRGGYQSNLVVYTSRAREADAG